MKNIHLNRTYVSAPWGGGNQFVKAFNDVCKNESVGKIYDVILLVGLDKDSNDTLSFDESLIYRRIYPNTKIILRVNECDARKNTNHVDKRWIDASKHIDGTVFVSHWIKDYFMSKGWACKNNIVIYNGVDENIFKPNTKFNNGKVNVVTHHWSDNPLKGADIYEKLDEFVGNNKNYTSTYIGRHKCNFKNTRVIPPLFGQQLGEELGKYDVYISASRFDPGPNHITESVSCKLPTYVHFEGGGSVEFAGSDHVYNTWEDIEKVLLENKFTMNVTKFNTWKNCIDEYVKFV